MASPTLERIGRVVGGVSRRFREAYEATGEPGPEIRVSPFRPGEVTGEAVALKSLAALIAGRRAAGNARQRREQTAATARYRDLLSQQLERKLSEPEPTMHEVEVPGYGKVRLTDQQLVSYARGQQSAADRQTESDLREQRFRDTFEAIESRFTRGQQAVQRRHDDLMRFRTSAEGRAVSAADRAAAGKEMDYWKGLMGSLDKREADVVADAEARALQYAKSWADIVLSPTASPASKAKAAKNLGLKPATDQAGAPLLAPGTNAPIYDTSDLSALQRSYAQRFKARKLADIKRLNEPDRLAYALRLRRAAGAFSGQPNEGGTAPSDPMDDIMELLRLYGEGDEDFLDRPAE